MADSSSINVATDLDPQFAADLTRLYRLMVWARWAVVVGLWLTLGSLSLWGMRFNLGLLWEHFTWIALRYALLTHRLSFVGLLFCSWMTLSVLLWQSRNILFGLSPADRSRLHQQLLRIRQQGKSHPLWRWLYGAAAH